MKCNDGTGITNSPSDGRAEKRELQLVLRPLRVHHSPKNLTKNEVGSQPSLRSVKVPLILACSLFDKSIPKCSLSAATLWLSLEHSTTTSDSPNGLLLTLLPVSIIAPVISSRSWSRTILRQTMLHVKKLVLRLEVA